MDDNNRKSTFSSQNLDHLGPHGKGDPNDLSLRVVEKEVLIAQMIREKLVQTICKSQADEYFKCVKESHLLIVPKCIKSRDALAECMKKGFQDKKFREECTREYLALRSEYRRTGVSQVQRGRRALAGSS